MKILVTGAAGYLGVGICNQLAREGHSIIAMDNLMYNQWHLVHRGLVHPNIEFYSTDCVQIANSTVKATDIIIPLAAIVGAPACDKKPKDSQAINVTQISNLVSQLNKSQRIIYPNSNSGLGQVEGIADENSPRNAVSLYGRQKDEAEDIVRTHSNHTVFRLATVFGVSWRTRTDLLVNTMVKEAIIDHENIEVFDPHFRRNFIHVDDITSAFSFAVNNPGKTNNEVFNLGNDQLNTTKLELAKRVGERCSVDVIVKEGNDPDKRDYEVSSAKLMKAGWLPYVDLEYGIDELVEFYQNLPSDETEREKILVYTRNV